MTDLLVVCTANVARSPLLAARLQLVADERLGAGAVDIASAGVEADFGAPAAAGSRTVGDRWERSLDDHQAVPISYLDLPAIPLILTMERAHRRALIQRHAELAARTFTVREFHGIVVALWQDEVPPALPVATPGDARARLEALAELADQHRPRRLLRRAPDVPDPVRQGQPVYDGLGEEFTRMAEQLATPLFGPGAP